MNTLFRCRCEQVLDAFLAISHKRDLQALELERGLEIARLRRERRILRQRVKTLERALACACEPVLEDRNPEEEDDFIQI